MGTHYPYDPFPCVREEVNRSCVPMRTPYSLFPQVRPGIQPYPPSPSNSAIRGRIPFLGRLFTPLTFVNLDGNPRRSSC